MTFFSQDKNIANKERQIIILGSQSDQFIKGVTSGRLQAQKNVTFQALSYSLEQMMPRKGTVDGVIAELNLNHTTANFNLSVPGWIVLVPKDNFELRQLDSQLRKIMARSTFKAFTVLHPNEQNSFSRNSWTSINGSSLPGFISSEFLYCFGAADEDSFQRVGKRFLDELNKAKNDEDFAHKYYDTLRL